MCKTNKNKLMHILESKVENPMVVSTVDACVIDGNFILHAMPPNLPGTYGGLARMLLIQISSLCPRRIDIVFDTYKTPSIKDLERGSRGAQDTVYKITGPEQARPKKMSDALKSASFKRNLPSFLVTEWEKPEYAALIGERDLYVGHGSTCHRFHVQVFNSARWKSFEKPFGPSATSKNPLQKLRGIDASCLPLCRPELLNHIKRSAFVARMWSVADKPFIDLEPREGWELVDGRYDIVWFSGQQLPEDLCPEYAPDDDDSEQLVLSSDDEVSDFEQ